MNKTTETTIAHDDIAALARQYWEEEGRPDGKDEEHWHRARRELEMQRQPQGSAKVAAAAPPAKGPKTIVTGRIDRA